MASRTIIIKLEGGKELEWKLGDDLRFSLLFERMRAAVNAPEPDIVLDGFFEYEMAYDLLTRHKGFHNYVMFRDSGYNKMTSDQLLAALRYDAAQVNYPELIEKTLTGQLVRMLFLDA